METDWLVQTIFLHFLRQKSTATSGSSFSFHCNIFQLILHSSQLKRVFCLLEKVSFYSEFFFCLRKLLMKLGESQFLKMNHIPAPGQQFFLFFQIFFIRGSSFFIQRKWKCIFQQVLYPASGDGFSVQWKQRLLIRAIFLLVEAIIGISFHK